MDYKKKYQKYKLKYNNLINNSGGGTILNKIKYLYNYLISKINKLNSKERKVLKEELIKNYKYSDNIKLETLNQEINENQYIENDIKNLSDELVYNTITKEEALKRGHPELEGIKEVMLGGGDLKIKALVFLSVFICKLYRRINRDSTCALYVDVIDYLEELDI